MYVTTRVRGVYMVSRDIDDERAVCVIILAVYECELYGMGMAVEAAFCERVRAYSQQCCVDKDDKLGKHFG